MDYMDWNKRIEESGVDTCMLARGVLIKAILANYKSLFPPFPPFIFHLLTLENFKRLQKAQISSLFSHGFSLRLRSKEGGISVLEKGLNY